MSNFLGDQNSSTFSFNHNQRKVFSLHFTDILPCEEYRNRTITPEATVAYYYTGP